MPQEFLQSKGISATINQILSGNGVAEQMDASSEFSPLREAKNVENRPEKLQMLWRFRKPRCRR